MKTDNLRDQKWWCCTKCDHQIYETWLNVDIGNCRAEEMWNMPPQVWALPDQSEGSELQHQPIRGQEMSPRTAIMFLRDPPPDSLAILRRSGHKIFVNLCNIFTGSYRNQDCSMDTSDWNLSNQLVLILQFPVPSSCCKSKWMLNSKRIFWINGSCRSARVFSLTPICTHNERWQKTNFTFSRIFWNVRSKTQNTNKKANPLPPAPRGYKSMLVLLSNCRRPIGQASSHLDSDWLKEIKYCSS